MKIKQLFPLQMHWQTQPPFLFCAHHFDRYPKGNSDYGPDPKFLSGRNMGSDFEGKDGFSMYHGSKVPGFPVHPHRGFETITIVRQGLVDHADSLGAAGRYGQGDVQWMTAGNGVQHSEMFPLLKHDQDNTLELFQIWLNLPRASKKAAADFKMLWGNTLPQFNLDQDRVKLTLICGEYEGQKFYNAPSASWASDPQHQVGIFLLEIQSGGTFNLPATSGQSNRTLYFFQGESLLVGDQKLQSSTGAILQSDVDLEIKNEGQTAHVLILQAMPINEPVVQYGPFVMNEREEILETIQEYQRTQFGHWPWPRPDMVHGEGLERFAKYPDGRIERPD